jgi:hypothetical protein
VPAYQIDHVVPFSISNDNDEANLQAICPNCHAIKTRQEARKIMRMRASSYPLCWWCETAIVSGEAASHGRGVCEPKEEPRCEEDKAPVTVEPWFEGKQSIDLSQFMYNP